MKKVAVFQSNYIPWKGYFDIVHDVDEFVFLDNVQYTIKDWRNRNKLYTQNGPKWLVIPVGKDQHRLIDEVMIPSPEWQSDHWNKFVQHYGKAPYFRELKAFFEPYYMARTWEFLSELNQTLIKDVSRMLGIKTHFSNSRDYNADGSKHTLILDLVKKSGADYFLSGPKAASYIIEDDYSQAGINLVYKDYSGYPEYPQMHKPFVHEVSIIDLLMNTGPDAPWYIWGWRESSLEGWRKDTSLNSHLAKRTTI